MNILAHYLNVKLCFDWVLIVKENRMKFKTASIAILIGSSITLSGCSNPIEWTEGFLAEKVDQLFEMEGYPMANDMKCKLSP